MVILLTLGCIWLVIAVLFFPFLCHMLSSDERAEDDLASIEYLRQWRREWQNDRRPPDRPQDAPGVHSAAAAGDHRRDVGNRSSASMVPRSLL